MWLVRPHGHRRQEIVGRREKKSAPPNRDYRLTTARHKTYEKVTNKRREKDLAPIARRQAAESGSHLWNNRIFKSNRSIRPDSCRRHS
jgi:hypothetical protein